MAYPILHNLTHSLADRIENLIAYSEIMTRSKYSFNDIALAVRKSITLNNLGKLCVIMLKIYVDTLITSMILKIMLELF